jgi:small subunit ribosomal protein S13
MLHLLGVNLPDRKLVSTALQYFYGIGEPTAMKLCKNLSIPPTKMAM